MNKSHRVRYRRRPANTQAWILGSGAASLASAFYLIKHAGIPPAQVHILDIHASLDEILYRPGDFANGYDQFPGCLPVPAGNSLQELLASVPSIRERGRTVLDEIRMAQVSRTSLSGHCETSFVVQKNGRLRTIPTKSLNLSLVHRLDLIRFLLKTEKRLGRNQIKDFLPNSFFQSNFWAIWSAQFGFQPWHSAVELKRALQLYLRDFGSLSITTCLDITGYYQYEFIFMPLCRFLQSLGVDFQFNTKVTDIVTTSENGQETISRLDLIQKGFPIQKHLSQHEIVLINLGSTISGSGTGTDSQPPVYPPIEANEELDENWSLWLELGARSDKFGNPYNFCTRLSTSILESFTITTHDLAFFERLNSLSRNSPKGGVFISLGESSWRMTVCVPTQPVFPLQPPDVRVIWGYALFPERKGEYTKKSMLHCSGEEIIAELLKCLNFPSDLLSQPTVTIPRVMPRMSSFLLARSLNDRPDIIPPNTTNVGLVGQFVEIPKDSCADLSFGVRTARIAASRLMGVDLQQVEQRRYSSSVLLKIFFWK